MFNIADAYFNRYCRLALGVYLKEQEEKQKSVLFRIRPPSQDEDIAASVDEVIQRKAAWMKTG